MRDRILASLSAVEQQRRARDLDPALAQKVALVKRFQQLRFEHTYADLLASARYAQAAHFFLVELYGPTDFRRRDQQFARVVPKLTGMFPDEVVSMVADLARLHALTELLDTDLSRCLADVSLTRGGYVSAWQQVGRPRERALQVELVLAIGKALDRITRHAWTIAALRMMRTPARAAGLSDLQLFLESGMASFRAMRGADEFLTRIQQREGALIARLFEADPAMLKGELAASTADENAPLADFPNSI